MLLDTLAGLSPTQLKWKPAPEVWSALEVAEHIVITEETVPETLRKTLAAPPTPEKKRAEVRQFDARILASVPLREQKYQAPETLRPAAKYATKEALADAFRRLRDANIAYLRETPDDLRGHFLAHPVLGELDVSEWYLLLAAHADRHVNQIRELMANPAFPKR